jgi:hypothetical protein
MRRLRRQRGEEGMKTLAMLLAILGIIVSFAAASSKISDESYRLLRQLISYTNREINSLHVIVDYMLDCHNVSDEQFESKKCTERMTAIQGEHQDLHVKHDVLGQAIASHIRQHEEEEWLFMGVMLDDKELSNLGH